MFFSLFRGKFSPQILGGENVSIRSLKWKFNLYGTHFFRNFPRLHLVVQKSKSCLCYVNHCKNIPNQAKIVRKSFKSGTSEIQLHLFDTSYYSPPQAPKFSFFFETRRRRRIFFPLLRKPKKNTVISKAYLKNTLKYFLKALPLDIWKSIQKNHIIKRIKEYQNSISKKLKFEKKFLKRGGLLFNHPLNFLKTCLKRGLLFNRGFLFNKTL